MRKKGTFHRGGTRERHRAPGMVGTRDWEVEQTPCDVAEGGMEGKNKGLWLEGAAQQYRGLGVHTRSLWGKRGMEGPAGVCKYLALVLGICRCSRLENVGRETIVI